MSTLINEDKATVFVIKNNGLLYGSGLNNYGQLGNNTDNNINLFTLIPLPLNKQCKTVNNGLYHTGVITTDGNLYMCGLNNLNQLGTELNIDKSLDDSLQQTIIRIIREAQEQVRNGGRVAIVNRNMNKNIKKAYSDNEKEKKKQRVSCLFMQRLSCTSFTSSRNTK